MSPPDLFLLFCLLLLIVSPSPFGSNLVFDLMGFGWGRTLGLGLDNCGRITSLTLSTFCFYPDSHVSHSVGGPPGKKETNNLESNNINNNGLGHHSPAPLLSLGPLVTPGPPHICGQEHQGPEQASDSDSCDRSDVIFQC